jgi:hypothetical protein
VQSFDRNGAREAHGTHEPSNVNGRHSSGGKNTMKGVSANDTHGRSSNGHPT